MALEAKKAGLWMKTVFVFGIMTIFVVPSATFCFLIHEGNIVSGIAVGVFFGIILSVIPVLSFLIIENSSEFEYTNRLFNLSNTYWNKFNKQSEGNYLDETNISLLFHYKMLKVTRLLFSNKIQIEVFEPMASDWQEEYIETLSEKEIWKARWINVRYTYAFLSAMWQKSPIGDLIEFIMKVAK